MSGNSTGGDTTIRYAPFLEDAAGRLIASGWEKTFELELLSPYANYVVTNPDEAFFGIGYVIGSFPSVYDMFGKFMAGLDIEALWNQIETDTIYGNVVAQAVATAAAEMDDQIENIAYPRMETGMRDMNAVQASTFLVNRAIIETDKIRALGKVQSDLNVHAMSLGQARWQAHLAWNAQVVAHYLSITQQYFQSHKAYLGSKIHIETAEILWPFTVLDHQRAIIGVLNGAHAAAIKHDTGFEKWLGAALGIASLITAPIGQYGGSGVGRGSGSSSGGGGGSDGGGYGQAQDSIEV